MTTLKKFRMLAMAAAVAVGAACSSTTGFDDPVDIDFRMQRIDDGMTMHVTAGVSFQLAGDAAALSPDTVASLTVTVDSIQALPAGGDEDDDGAWVTAVLDAPVTLDLKTLPTTGASPIVIASGTVNADVYTNVRLFVSDVTIEFKGPIALAAGITLNPGTTYDVTVPSAAQTGIKTDAGFDASASTDVDLLFDESATFGNVTATGTGTVMLAPVIRSGGNGS